MNLPTFAYLALVMEVLPYPFVAQFQRILFRRPGLTVIVTLERWISLEGTFLRAADAFLNRYARAWNLSGWAGHVVRRDVEHADVLRQGPPTFAALWVS